MDQNHVDQIQPFKYSIHWRWADNDNGKKGDCRNFTS